MLRELHISNLAVIEDVRLELGEGLNCFTGQTGAGKSLMLQAFGLLLGFTKAGKDMLRPGADEARVIGLFEIRDAGIAEAVSQAADQTIAAGEELLITRKLFASGRTSVSINGQPATAMMGRAIGELLVDVHGQHDQQYLLKPSNQLLMLDAFGSCEKLRDEYRSVYGEQRELSDRLQQLSASRTIRKQQLELYEFQANEIDDAQLEEGEYDELRSRLKVLSNLQVLKKNVGAAHSSLFDSEGSLVERLQVTVHLLMEMVELDETLGEVAEQICTATLSLQESAYELNRYSSQLEMDPAELDEVEQRLNTLNRLLSKYGVDDGREAILGLIDYRKNIENDIVRLRSETEDLSTMQQAIDDLEERLKTTGAKLTKARQKSAAKMKPLIDAELRELGMSEAEFNVSIEPDELGASGVDHVEFYIRTNPGQPARPLRKIASGGEMSRVMLGMKSIFAESDRVSVLVFDEIDANVGGRMGTVIGQKMRKLADSNHQVLCITHLPQIAAFADRHLRISKHFIGRGQKKQTRTLVSLLEGAVRVDELAEMLAGSDVTTTTRKQVEEMLSSAGR